MTNSSNASFIPSTLTISEAPCFVDDSSLVRCIRIFVYCLIIFVSLIGNSLVVTIVYKDKTLRKPIDYFIVNMSCSDLVITIVYMPRVVTVFAFGYRWLLDDKLGTVACKIVPFVYEVSVTVSILTVVALSVERFFLLVFPFKTIVSNRFAKLVVVATWITAIAVRFPISYAINLKDLNNKTYCNLMLDEEFGYGVEKIYYQIILLSMYAVPMAVIIILYSVIIVTLTRHKKPGHSLVTGAETREEQRNSRVFKMILAVVAAFIVCWMLYFIQLVLHSYKIVVPCEVHFVRWVFAHSNCALTPCLYFLFSEIFRNGLKNMFADVFITHQRKRHNQDTEAARIARIPSIELLER